MKPWQLKETELLRKEHEYLTKFNLFEQLIDDHLYYVLLYILLIPISFGIGVGIGLLI